MGSRDDIPPAERCEGIRFERADPVPRSRQSAAFAAAAEHKARNAAIA